MSPLLAVAACLLLVFDEWRAAEGLTARKKSSITHSKPDGGGPALGAVAQTQPEDRQSGPEEQPTPPPGATMLARVGEGRARIRIHQAVSWRPHQGNSTTPTPDGPTPESVLIRAPKRRVNPCPRGQRMARGRCREIWSRTSTSQ